MNFAVRPGRAEDIAARARIDTSFSTERVLIIDVTGPAPEHTISMRWEQAKPPGSRRNIDSVPGLGEFRANVEKADAFWVVEAAGAPAGFLVLSHLDWHPSTGFIDEIAVDRPARGRGMGKALVQAAKAFTREKGRRGILWEAQTDNEAAVRFAIGQGFAFAGYNDSFYNNRGLSQQRSLDFRGLALFLYWPAD
jgi:ribosomal protein S18 acetylase RimI-like enzyme